MNFWQILVFPKDFHDLCHFCSFSGRFSAEVTLPLNAARSFQKVLPCLECDVSKTTECFAKDNFNAKDLSLVLTGWKVSKYRTFSGPYMPVSGLNTETYGVNQVVALQVVFILALHLFILCLHLIASETTVIIETEIDYWNRTSAWVFSCKFAAYFQNTFS